MQLNQQCDPWSSSQHEQGREGGLKTNKIISKTMTTPNAN